MSLGEYAQAPQVEDEEIDRAWRQTFHVGRYLSRVARPVYGIFFSALVVSAVLGSVLLVVIQNPQNHTDMVFTPFLNQSNHSNSSSSSQLNDSLSSSSSSSSSSFSSSLSSSSFVNITIPVFNESQPDETLFSESIQKCNYARLLVLIPLWRKIWVDTGTTLTRYNITSINRVTITEFANRLDVNNNETQIGIFNNVYSLALLQPPPPNQNNVIPLNRVIVQYALVPPVLPVILVNGSRYTNYSICTDRCINGHCVHKISDPLPNPSSFYICNVTSPCQFSCHVACSSNVCNSTQSSTCVDYTNHTTFCQCPIGLTNSGPTTCTDIDECHIDSQALALCLSRRGDNAVCVNTYGSYYCWCRLGYESPSHGPDVQCVNIDECESGTHGCSHECRDTQGSYICLCPPQYVLDVDSETCLDFNECTWELNACASHHSNCTNLPGTYTCACDVGYEGGGTACMNRNECLSPEWNNCDPDSTNCIDTSGSFVCLCATGYADLEYVNGTQLCHDINECEDEDFGFGNCNTHATCMNLPGSWNCTCNSGYVGNGDHCRLLIPCIGDETECAFNHSRCITLDYTECICDEGWQRNQTTFQCDDINECEIIDQSHCQLHSTCVNTPGLFVCQCDQGYSSIHENSTLTNSPSCVNINECNFPDLHHCTANSTCVDTIPGYSCICLSGLVLNETSGNCVDANECDTGTHDCDQVCINTVGSFTCDCDLDGFLLNEDGIHCDEFHPCENVTCGGHGVCVVETFNTTSCTCDSGYVAEDLGGGVETCVDIDECTDDPCQEPEQSVCLNLPGSFQCLCSDGYELENGTTCVDFNECLSECIGGHHVCENLPGTFNCSCEIDYAEFGIACLFQNTTCPSGYYVPPEVTNETCSDFNECTENVHNCDTNTSACENTDHSFTCVCLVGYAGLPCENVDECSNSSLFDCSGIGWANTTQCIDTEGSYICECKTGFQLVEEMCADVDECQDTSNCTDNSTYLCNNTFGSVLRTCRPGYTGSGCQCYDVDECTIVDICPGNHTTCHNTNGSYTCPCVSGYELVEESDCVNIVECDLEGFSDCQGPEQFCIDDPGSYHCGCEDGFQLDPDNSSQCININECETESNVCGVNEAICIDLVGPPFFNCTCPVGHIYVDMVCIDIDECAEGTHQCAPALIAECINTHGSYDCQCDPGYQLDGFTCLDIDECLQVDPRACPDLSVCTNTEGDFNCTCFSGYELIDSECVDIDECSFPELNNCCFNRSICTNLPGLLGGFTCECIAGFSGDGVTCSNVNECYLHLDDCGAHSTCIDTVGSFTCQCLSGFSGDTNGYNCTDINECTLDTDNCQDSSTSCRNTQGSYACDCLTGFHTSSLYACSDNDECTSFSHNCAANGTSTCTNTVGSFTCTCSDGFSGDGLVCSDVNECTDETHNCSTRASCSNTFGSYSCSCNTGWHGDGFTCDDNLECIDHSHNCAGDTATCTETPGSFSCACNQNFTGNGITCNDIDECVTGTHNCVAPGSTCINLFGGFQCECTSGYQAVQSDQSVCQDINECNTRCHTCNCTNLPGNYSCDCVEVNACTIPEDNNCSVYATCTPINETFSCACFTGYEGDGVNCTQINECTLGTHDCDPLEPWSVLCIDTPGSWDCQCLTGYLPLPGHLCTDINECAQQTDLCDRNISDCVNSNGSYSCVCHTGYILNGTNHCIDVNECLQTNTCDPVHGICTNTNGSYICSCQPGYSWNTITCVDINECTVGAYPCWPNNTVCVNTDGSYLCHCNSGYAGPGAGVPCLNVDECALGYDNCSAHATCVDLTPFWRCDCNAGYVDNGAGTCVDINECASSATNNCTNTSSVCQNSQGGFGCNCNHGYTQTSPYTCSDINECLGNEAGCSNNSVCQNSQGSVECTCSPGYSGPGRSCSDINECTLGTNNCSPFATCTNTVGSFTCACNTGWVSPTNDGVTCVDRDECASNATYTCPGNSTCLNQNGTSVTYPNGYSCPCDSGFNLTSPGVCSDINECLNATLSQCGANATCVNSPGTWSCPCLSGYTRTNNGTGPCLDVNECSANATLCGNNATCTNTLGGYNCTCNSGFSKAGNGSCVDLNECLSSPCPAFSTCSNTFGSYTCTCQTGYTMSGNVCVDNNECSLNTDDCSPHAACANTAGSFTCTCNAPMWTGNGVTCTHV